MRLPERSRLRESATKPPCSSATSTASPNRSSNASRGITIAISAVRITRESSGDPGNLDRAADRVIGGAPSKTRTRGRARGTGPTRRSRRRRRAGLVVRAQTAGPSDQPDQAGRQEHADDGGDQARRRQPSARVGRRPGAAAFALRRVEEVPVDLVQVVDRRCHRLCSSSMGASCSVGSIMARDPSEPSADAQPEPSARCIRALPRPRGSSARRSPAAARPHVDPRAGCSSPRGAPRRRVRSR